MSILVGCINNKLGSSSKIRTRFFLLENNNIQDVTENICNKVNESKISNFKFDKGLANYSFGCGLSHYLNNENISQIGFKDCTIEMLTLNDIKQLLKCKNVFDINISEAVKEFYKNR